MIRRISLAVAACSVFLVATAAAQPSSLSVSVRAGTIQTYWTNISVPEIRSGIDPSDIPYYALYPEVEVEGLLATFGGEAFSMRAAASWGYWDDGAQKGAQMCDYARCRTIYPYSSHVAALRLGLGLEQWTLPVPVFLSVGLARHYPEAKIRAGSRYADPSDAIDPFTTGEVGLQVEAPLTKRLRAEGGVRQFIRRNWTHSLRNPRYVFQVGLSYALL